MEIKKVVRVGKVEGHDLFCKINFVDGKLSISGVIGPKRNGDFWGGCGQIDMEFAHRNPEDNDRRYSNPTKPEEIVFAPGWDTEKWLDFLDVWNKWHLNDMKPGCEHQENWDTNKEIELVHYNWTSQFHKWRKSAESGLMIVDLYEQFRKISEKVMQITIGLNCPKWETPLATDLLYSGWIQEGKREKKTAGWVNQKEHPEGLLESPCPVCGHKYGSAWLKKEVPADVLEFLNGLPDTDDTTPAWV